MSVVSVKVSIMKASANIETELAAQFLICQNEGKQSNSTKPQYIQKPASDIHRNSTPHYLITWLLWHAIHNKMVSKMGFI
jgi:hypothetical protein